MLSEKPWKPEAIMLLASAVFFCLAATVGIGLGLEFLLPNLPVERRQFYNFLTSSLGFHGMILVLTVPFLKFHGTTWRQFLGFDQARWRRHVAIAAGLAVPLVPFELALNHLAAQLLLWLTVTPEYQSTIKVLQVSVSPWQRACFGAAAIGLAPLAEEILFRGILYPVVKQLGRPQLAVIGTSLLFAAIHSNLMTFLPLFVFSLLMIWLYEHTDTLAAPVIAHALFNAANFTLFFFEPQLRSA
ncbi:MAG: CPBP family intramembrane metalloprotease [Verrucomicrobia bacterium]|nr:CPBP family intramembrane metalloprotease [Verrucomicrobiota bacterium]